MQDETIILRLKRSIARDIFLGGATPSSTPEMASNVIVEVEDVRKGQLPNLARHNDVVAFAPVMPMKLVEPFNVVAAGAAAPGPTWGVKAVGAPQSSFTGKDVVVAVLDTGIDATHPTFKGVELIEKDFTGQGNGDHHGHGTHCAGTIFGRDVDNVRIGVAQGVSKALIGKVLGKNSGSSAGIINAIQWASQNGANVISMSLGIDFPGFVQILIGQGVPPALATSQALEAYRANVQLFEKMAQFIKVMPSFFQTTLLIAAAGNESRLDVDNRFEISVSPPAVSDGFISVAALGQEADGKLSVAPFSNTGAMIAGPGVDVISAKAGGGLAIMSGTSMATPHVAGVAALWIEKLRNSGFLNPTGLTAELIASGVTDNMASGFNPARIGTGLVKAP